MDNKHECLIKEFQSLKPPVFRGSSDISIAEEWFHEIEKKLGLMRLTDEERIILSTSMLKGEASHWWDINRDTIVDEGMTWRQFEDSFLERYYPFSDRNLKKIELMRLARMEYLDSVEKKRDKGKAGSSEISGAVKMVKLESEEIDDVRICSPLRVEQEQQAVQDGAIEVRNANLNGELQQQRKQQKPEVAVVEVTGDMKDSRQQPEAAHTVINLEEHQKQLQENMKQYVHQLVSQQVQQLHQQKQQPLALVESNTKEQNRQQRQQQPEVALVGASTNLIGTQQQPEVAHGGSNIVERVKEVQLQTKRYMHRVLLQMQQPQKRQELQLQQQQQQEPQQQMQQQHLHQQQKQKQQQQQQKRQDHQTPQNERKQGKKRKHHNAEVALVQVNMEEFWANERNRKKAKKIVKQVQTAEKQQSSSSIHSASASTAVEKVSLLGENWSIE
ncbi:putative uncharacterized protein DDB_G0271606 [Papaver somniferum]|uniref:putative uncharacterized protein DDB_G0271606 n=1 Tax=Papaver somniferum TaxID=3469 RepID=UPI000E6FAE79|nr:putative uncharacterized protein DDB_G0271606 [Papaver somniferum]